MDQTTLPRLSLFDLLARCWTLKSPVARIVIDTGDTAAAFACNDGRVALAPIADPEAPEQRLRMDLESGRTMIRPRERPAANPIVTDSFGPGPVPIAAIGGAGFVIGDGEGALLRLTPRGQVVRLLKSGAAAVTALAAHPASGCVAVIRGTAVALYAETDLALVAQIETAVPATGLAFSPDGARIAIAGSGGLTIWRVKEGGAVVHHDIALLSAPVWSADGNWIAAATVSGGLGIVAPATGRCGLVDGFPAPPRSVGFSVAADALVTSGAYRLAGWSMAAPPLDGCTAGALRTGRPGLVLVDSVAPHPLRDLAAAGYRNGALTLARIGQADEMELRSGDAAAVTALAWSRSGDRLAVGCADGSAAVVGLPKQLFK